jgi:hypothetical protein
MENLGLAIMQQSDIKEIYYRQPKWHDPIVLGLCVFFLSPFFVYGIFLGSIKSLFSKKHQPCQQIKGGLSDEEIIILRELYMRNYNKIETNDSKN